MTQTILIVDDEPTQRAILDHILKDTFGYQTVVVPGGQEAIDYVLSGRQPQPDLMLLDLSMPRVNGIAVIKSVHPQRPDLPIIVVTAHGSFAMAVEAMRAGAMDFMAKPAEPERLSVSITNALRMSVLNDEVTRLQRNAHGQVLFSDIIGTSPLLRAAIDLGQKAATSTIPVTIVGEAGSGKELLARAIHGSSERAGESFVTVKCSAYADPDLEVTLFGSRPGGPGGAMLVLGKCREADGGTLFLDNVGMLRPAQQVKLLKLLQEHIVEPAGSREGIPVDVRVIASVPVSLEAAVQRGEFRQDLYYLLNALPISMPTLRERREDIPVLVEHHLHRLSALEDKAIHGASSDAMNELKRFSWPGNIRQLENAIFRAVVLCEGDMLNREDFHYLIGQQRDAISGIPRVTENGLYGVTPRLMQGSLTVTDGNGNVRRMIDLEIDMIKFALHYYDGHMSEVARRLGIGRSTLYRKINDFGIIEHHQ